MSDATKNVEERMETFGRSSSFILRNPKPSPPMESVVPAIRIGVERTPSEICII